MAGYKADEYVTNNGPRGNGYSYEQDKKTGKYGVRYANGRFVPDSDEKQPGYTPPSEESVSASGPSGPSDYDIMIDNLGNEVGSVLSDSAKMTGKFIKGIIAFFISFAAASTFVNEISENPHDIKGAAVKTGRTIACGIGIVLDIIAMFVFALIFGNTENPVVYTVGSIIGILQLYTVWGLVRVARGKPFWINPVTIYRKIRTIKVPKIVYIGIELLVTILMTKPILTIINSFTVGWQNQDSISDSLVIILGVAMLVGSIIIAAIIGLIACRLIKAVTAKTE